MRYDRTLYFDFEYTCWDGPTPDDMVSETIQMGVVEADTKTLEITRMGRYYVRPVESEVSEFCTSLTGITREKLRKEGRPLREAVASMAKVFGPRSKVAYTWGSDGLAFEQIAKVPGGHLFFPQKVDLGTQYRIEYGLDRNVSLLEALKLLGNETDGRAHDAQIDAMNVAALHLIQIEQRRYGRRITVFKHELDCVGLRRFPVGYEGCTCLATSSKRLSQR